MKSGVDNFKIKSLLYTRKSKAMLNTIYTTTTTIMTTTLNAWGK